VGEPYGKKLRRWKCWGVRYPRQKTAGKQGKRIGVLVQNVGVIMEKLHNQSKRKTIRRSRGEDLKIGGTGRKKGSGLGGKKLLEKVSLTCWG